MIDFQSHLVFPTHAVPHAGPLPQGAERLSLRTPDGQELIGTRFPPDNETGLLILGFGGNAWNGQDVAKYLHELFPDADTVAFHYRGYAPSTGSPSAEALIADAPLIYDFVKDRLAPRRIVAVGLSIGSGVAAELAAVRPLDGLILVTPFDSLSAVAQSMYPWLPIRSFFHHEIDAANALRRTKAPVAIIGAGTDEIVPAIRTQALRKDAKKLVFDRTIAGAGHNDLYSRSEFQAAMREALDRLNL